MNTKNEELTLFDEIQITPEMIEQDRIANELEYAKALKKQELDEIVVTTNNVKYKGDEKAQLNMTSVGCIANWQFNLNLKKQMEAILADTSMSVDTKVIAGIVVAVYEAVYTDNKIDWKNGDGKNSNVQIESILESLHKTMLSKGDIITK